MGGVDRFSELPEDIIHVILSSLSLKQVIRISVLSKTLLHVCSTNPYLDFDDTHFIPSPDNDERENLLDFFEKTLIRYTEESTPIHRLSIRTRFYDKQLGDLVDNWIQTAIQNSAQILKFHYDRGLYLHHPLSETTIKSLTILKLCGYLSRRLLGYTIKFHSLKELSLKFTFMREPEFQNLISRCPLIEKLSLKKCTVSPNVRLANLQKLKVSELYGDQVIMIEAPSLRSFTCENMTITNYFCNDLMSKYPLLEDLKIVLRYDQHRINLSSLRVKNLILIDNRNLVELKVDAPNLLSLQYNSFSVPNSFFITTTPRQWNVTIQVTDDWINTLWLYKLTMFLNNLNEFGVLSLVVRGWSPTYCGSDMKGVRKHLYPPPHKIQHLKLDVWCSPDCATLVDELLWCCHPKTLSIYISQSSSNNCIKKICNMLIQRQCLNCCKFGHFGCWRHCLKDAEVESFRGTEYDTFQLGTLLDSLPSLPELKSINFRLKW